MWASVRDLYKGMESRVMHPGIPQDEFFPIDNGTREGSVLSPILFVIAVDDMSDYLSAHPFQDRNRRHTQSWSAAPPAKQQRREQRAPGLRVGPVHLPLLQFVDDAV